MEAGTWKLFKINKSGPAVSHLCFANDMLLFAGSNESRLSHIMNCLNLFCEASGQNVSVVKTDIFRQECFKYYNKEDHL